MVVKVVINGFGCIGCNVLCGIIESGCIDIEVVVINDLGLVEINVYLLCYDLIYGCFFVEVKVVGNIIDVGCGLIEVIVICNFVDLFWVYVDVVLECIGIFILKEKCQLYFENGVSCVLILVLGIDVDKIIVYGVNYDMLILDDLIVLNVLCIINCLLFVVKVLNDIIGIIKGFMIMIYSYIGDQLILDIMYKDLYCVCVVVLLMILILIGVVKVVGLVLLELNGKLDGVVICVFILNVLVVDLIFEVLCVILVEEINNVICVVVDGLFKGIFGYIDELLVLIDFNYDLYLLIFYCD